jgi:hypothetical protein
MLRVSVYEHMYMTKGSLAHARRWQQAGPLYLQAMSALYQVCAFSRQACMPLLLIMQRARRYTCSPQPHPTCTLLSQSGFFGT